MGCLPSAGDLLTDMLGTVSEAQGYNVTAEFVATEDTPKTRCPSDPGKQPATAAHGRISEFKKFYKIAPSIFYRNEVREWFDDSTIQRYHEILRKIVHILTVSPR